MPSKTLSRAFRFVGLFTLCAAAALAQPAYRVKDIDTAPQPNPLDFLGSFGSLEETVFFGASTAGNPEQLWRSDGTRAGTVLIKSLHTEGYGPPSDFVRLGDGLYFFANGAELWKTDGTPSGTVLVRTLAPVPGYPPHDLIATDDALFFSADDGIHGYELWRSDGTVDGTVMLADLSPGDAGSNPYALVRVGSGIVFFAGDEHGDTAVWKSDGTSAGTVVFADLGETPVRYPFSLTSVSANRFFFLTQQYNPDQSTGYTLWTSDGTQTGTVALHDFVADWPGACPGPCFPIPPSDLTPLGTGVLLVANDGTHGREIWRSDGTVGGTSLVVDLVPGGESSTPTALTRFGDAVYFDATEGIHGYELWRTDGTGAGTALVKDIVPGPDGSGPYFLTAFAGKLYFLAATDGGFHYQLWISDGTEAGTHLLKDVTAVSTGYGPFVPAGDVLFFLGSGSGVTGLWKTDGTEAGTVLVSDFSTDANAGSYPFYLTDVAGRLFFSARLGEDSQSTTLWTSDGTETGTLPVTTLSRLLPSTIDPAPGSTSMGGRFFFGADDGVHGDELWSSDGTPAGTKMVRDIAVPGPSTGVVDSYPGGMVPIGSTLFFAAADGDHGFELWKSDGTEAGTTLVKDIRPGPEGSTDGNGFGAAGGLLFFGADDGVHGGELWRSDGSADGTFLVKDINPGANGSGIVRFVAPGAALFFIATDGDGPGLWTSDGTEAGTRRVAALTTLAGSPNGYSLMSAGGLLYFTDSQNGQLWRSDGTEEGTYLLLSFAVANLVEHAGALFFTADDGNHGAELWRSDGTAAGTALFADIQPGRLGSMALYSGTPVMASVGGLLVFAADDGEHGSEPWVSDGTAEGTRMIQDINPGTASSAPSQFTKSGSLLYFTADDGVTGNELWAIPLSALTTPRDAIDPVAGARPTRTVGPRQ